MKQVIRQTARMLLFGFSLGILCTACGLGGGASNLNAIRIGQAPDPLPATAEEARQKIVSPSGNLTPDTFVDLKNQIVGFSCDTYPVLRKTSAGQANRLFAPASLYTVLAWLSEGCDAETQATLLHTLKVSDLSTLRDQMRLFSGLSYAGDESSFINANSLWVSKTLGTAVNQAFLDVSKNDYRSDLFSVDFHSKEAGASMSEYLIQKTDGLLNQMPAPNKDTTLSLLNTFYFAAQWQTPFVESETKDAPFTNAIGETETVPFMTRTWNTRVFRHPDFDAVSLPLQTGRVCLILPTDPNGLDTLCTDATPLHQALTEEGTDPYQLTVLLPRFTLRSDGSLAEGLKQTAVAPLFDEHKPALVQMFKHNPACLDDVIQGCYFSADEAGVKAAGYTRADVKETAALPPPQSLTLNFNHPFLVVLYNEEDLPILIGEVRRLTEK